MTKPREKNREELQAEIEDGKRKIRQFENREKMLRQKLSKEERRTRSHRLIVRGAVFESIVPEAKTMTDEEARMKRKDWPTSMKSWAMPASPTPRKAAMTSFRR